LSIPLIHISLISLKHIEYIILFNTRSNGNCFALGNIEKPNPRCAGRYSFFERHRRQEIRKHIQQMSPIDKTQAQLEKRSGFDRRDGKIRILSKYWLTGKRTIIRRTEDRRKLTLIDRHSARTFAAILLIITLSVIDAIFTLSLIDSGAAELNPIMAYYLGHGPLAFFWVKYLLTCAAVLILLLIKNIPLFNTRFQAKILLIVVLIPYVFVIQWEIYLLLTR